MNTIFIDQQGNKRLKQQGNKRPLFWNVKTTDWCMTDPYRKRDRCVKLSSKHRKYRYYTFQEVETSLHTLPCPAHEKEGIEIFISLLWQLQLIERILTDVSVEDDQAYFQHIPMNQIQGFLGKNYLKVLTTFEKAGLWQIQQETYCRGVLYRFRLKDTLFYQMASFSKEKVKYKKNASKLDRYYQQRKKQMSLSTTLLFKEQKHYGFSVEKASYVSDVKEVLADDKESILMPYITWFWLLMHDYNHCSLEERLLFFGRQSKGQDFSILTLLPLWCRQYIIPY